MSQVYVTDLACSMASVRQMSQVWHVVRQMSHVWNVFAWWASRWRPTKTQLCAAEALFFSIPNFLLKIRSGRNNFILLCIRHFLFVVAGSLVCYIEVF